MKSVPIAAAAFAISTAIAHAEEPIIGNWKTELGDTAAIASCGGAYCITLKSGKQIGTFNGKDGTYSGKSPTPGPTRHMTAHSPFPVTRSR